MTLRETFTLISNLYSGKPFIDSTGNLTLVPDKVDCLIDAFRLFERFFYEHPDEVTILVRDRFLQETKEFMVTIPLNLFKRRILDLEWTAKETILRNMDKLVNAYPEDQQLLKYESALCS